MYKMDGRASATILYIAQCFLHIVLVSTILRTLYNMYDRSSAIIYYTAYRGDARGARRGRAPPVHTVRWHAGSEERGGEEGGGV